MIIVKVCWCLHNLHRLWLWLWLEFMSTDSVSCVDVISNEVSFAEGHGETSEKPYFWFWGRRCLDLNLVYWTLRSFENRCYIYFWLLVVKMRRMVKITVNNFGSFGDLIYFASDENRTLRSFDTDFTRSETSCWSNERASDKGLCAEERAS